MNIMFEENALSFRPALRFVGIGFEDTQKDESLISRRF
jgi:hypothetical protein